MMDLQNDCLFYFFNEPHATKNTQSFPCFELFISDSVTTHHLGTTPTG